MFRLPFDQLGGDEAFVALCADLLAEEGFRNVRGRGTGPDQAKDLFAEVDAHSPLGGSLIRVLVQCKHYGDRPVGDSDISSSLASLQLHQVDAVLFMTSSHFSGTAVTKMNASRSESGQPKAYYWDGDELTRRLWRHPWLVDRHWRRRSGEGLTVQDTRYFAKSYCLPPRYAGLGLDTFPVTPENGDHVREMREYAAGFEASPSLVTVVTGALGAGKTGYAASLIALAACDMDLAAYVGWHDFRRLAWQMLNQADECLRAFSFLASCGYLVIDDIDHEFVPDVESDGFVCDLLTELVRLRIEGRKPTIITVTDLRLPRKTVQSVASLALQWPRIHVGDRSLRSGNPKSDREWSTGCSLGKPWLLEKLERLNGSIERAMATIAMPEWEYEGEQSEAARATGRRTGRLEAVLHLLRQVISESDSYIEFIESLDFSCIEFHGDGTKTLR